MDQKTHLLDLHGEPEYWGKQINPTSHLPSQLGPISIFPPIPIVSTGVFPSLILFLEKLYLTHLLTFIYTLYRKTKLLANWKKYILPHLLCHKPNN